MNILIVCDNLNLLPIIKDIISTKNFSMHVFTYASTSAQVSRKTGIKYLNIKRDYRKKMIGYYELIFSMHCKQIFPAELVSRIRCVNIHPGLIPFNRGWYPHVFSIINKKPAGATIHEMDKAIDHGPVIVKKTISIKPWENSLDIYKKVVEAETILLKDNIERIINHNYKAKKVSSGNLNTSIQFKKLCKLNMNKKMKLGEAIDLLRALTHPPYTNAFFIDKISGRKVYVDVCLKPEGNE
jgi:dTDP-4-amino-4,6-dideoxyglucose formyltransferase